MDLPTLYPPLVPSKSTTFYEGFCRLLNQGFSPTHAIQPNRLTTLPPSHSQLYCIENIWWRLGCVDSFQPEGRGFDSRSSRHVGTLGKSFTCSCLCASARNSDTVSMLWSGAPLSSRRYRNGQNE